MIKPPTQAEMLTRSERSTTVASAVRHLLATGFDAYNVRLVGEYDDPALRFDIPGQMPTDISYGYRLWDVYDAEGDHLDIFPDVRMGASTTAMELAEFTADVIACMTMNGDV